MSTIRSGTTDTDTVSEGIVNVRGNTADTAPVGRVIWSSGGESPTNIASINLTTTASDNQISTRAQDTHARLLVSQSSLVNGVIRGSSSPRLMAYGAVGSEKGMERYRTDTQHNYAGLAERSTSNRSVASLGNESQIPTQYMDSEITEAVDTTAYTNQHESYRPNESQTQMLTQPRNSPYQTYTTKSTQRNNRSSSLVDLISTFTPARSPRPSKILPTVSKVTGQKTRPQVDEDQGDE
ncbi:hypothetical protein SARC_08732 [Sphaeroforma arctica JP610]|uniref:Uncharacterized protein n=1 Tax=Sphaeroforma arctica JP610 TaxID=667725 RepID=A0A0L0FS99_9EUKA|nr:hypothetical protein SARC_08732 [Sphaeroforma arctica JP610]KNC78858.1 hypothetical protein SARC_08732 [Sphaeroforma arctica JP610]|eukprot:XP_014152760.1 hypothetical protein SARC_08732 [Sphaeroforma arctica JP610]